MPTVNPYGRDAERQIAAVKCWMVLRGAACSTGPAPWAGPWTSRSGGDGRIDQQAAVAELVDWAVSLPHPCAEAAVSGGTKYEPVPLGDAHAFLQRTLDRPTWLGTSHLMVTAGAELRSVDVLSQYGFAAASRAVRNGAPLDWQQAVEETRDLLTSAGSWCTHAHLTRGSGSMGLSANQPDGDRRVDNPWASNWHDWSEFVTQGGFFDAYGVMRLPAHLRAQVEPPWHVSDLPDGQMVAEHPDLPAWFAASRIDDPTLQHARAVLGDALLDRSGEKIRA